MTVPDQVVARAEEVLGAQNRLQGLPRALHTIAADLDGPAVLRRLVEAARELVGARHAAVGLLAADGHLAEFVHTGTGEEDDTAPMGGPSRGTGVSGDDPVPIRLAELIGDRRSSEVPPGHPRVPSFLGVPVEVRGQAVGRLYLADPVAGTFSAEDEELVTALAAVAGTVIENVRLVDADRARRRWLQASSAITGVLLASDTGDVGSVLGPIAEQCREVAAADLVTVALPALSPRSGEPVELRVHTASGRPGTETLLGQALPLRGTLAGRVFTTATPMRQSGPHLEGPVVGDVELGPVLAVPLRGRQRCHGVLTVARRSGRTEFAATDLDMAADFADHASVAIELVEARAEERHAAMLDERDRIAADLHDHVIQRLFATGLSLSGLLNLMHGDPRRARVDAAVDDLDEIIRQIRTTIFDLHAMPGAGPSPARTRLLEVVDQFAPVLGFLPETHIDQTLDEPVPRDVVDDLLAVLREALSNIARHAQAGAVRVTARAVAGQLTLEVADDGVGVGSSTRRSGLGNLRRRAELHHGTLTVTDNRPCGTCLTWTVTPT